jgi:hypothetical protein
MFEQYKKNLECRLFYKHFKNLSEECQKVIKFYLEKIKTKTIAHLMSYNNVIAVRRKKYDCRLALIRNIRKDPEFVEIMEHEYEHELRHINN